MYWWSRSGQEWWRSWALDQMWWLNWTQESCMLVLLDLDKKVLLFSFLFSFFYCSFVSDLFVVGPYSKMAGHDINYAALSGALSVRNLAYIFSLHLVYLLPVLSYF